MEKNKECKFLLKRLKNWEETRYKEKGWEENFKRLNNKIDNSLKNEEDIKKEKYILECLRSIIEESEKAYIESEEIELNKIELPKEGEEYKKIEKDIMFELQDNYPIDLDNLGIENFCNVLNLSINPGSTQKEGQTTNSNEGKIDNIIMPLYSFNLDKKMSKRINPIIKKYGINEKYIWRRYYNPNFEIFNDINAKFPWVALKREMLKEEFKKILKEQANNIIKEKENKLGDNIEKIKTKFSEERQKDDVEEFMKIYDKERNDYNKELPLVFFNDLFWIADSNQKDLLSILEKYKDKEKMKLFIKEMIDLYIKKYKLGLIVVTNVKAAEYVKSAIGDTNRENCVFKYTYTDEEIKEKKVVPIIFSGYLANGMDQFSKTRLKKDIKEYYQICDKY